MIESYFPVGSGFGGFDQTFRLHEPFALLMPTYFNHAHNDFQEIALDGGLPAILLLGAATVWWAIASLRAWRAGPEAQHILPKLGSAMLLLVFVASLVDYPARTPMIMAMIVIAAVWLARAAPRAALPEKNQHL
jgi:O-antigen ligase